MSKKQRRKQSRRASPPAQSAPAPVAAVEETPQEAPVAASAAGATPVRRATPVVKSKAQPSWKDFAERYSYVNRELKQIGILAGSFLVVLLILTAILG